MTKLAQSVRDHVDREHADVVEAVDAAADAVADAWPGDSVTDRRAVVEPMRTTLDREGVHQRLPEVLADVVRAAGYELRAPPVAGPPYVVMTSRGPVLRATIDPGRLVVRFDAFAVERDPDTAYRRLEGVDLVVSVE